MSVASCRDVLLDIAYRDLRGTTRTAILTTWKMVRLMAQKPILHLHGLVRRVDVKRKNDDNSIYGVGIAVLSEPDGDVVEVTAFARDLDPTQAQALVGENIHATVSPGARAGSRGGAFLDVSLVALVGVEAKAK